MTLGRACAAQCHPEPERSEGEGSHRACGQPDVIPNLSAAKVRDPTAPARPNVIPNLSAAKVRDPTAPAGSPTSSRT